MTGSPDRSDLMDADALVIVVGADHDLTGRARCEAGAAGDTGGMGRGNERDRHEGEDGKQGFQDSLL